MEPHFPAFIATDVTCIAALSSSSFMKLSKTILNPNRTIRNDGGAVSLSFLCRRRANSGSFHQASSSTTAAGKKRGGGVDFGNPEPSSPKVTCIGQVRVKSARKRSKQRRSLSQIRRTGDVSFRKADQKNQRWVHLPPCRFSSCCCFPRNNNNNNASGNGGCGAVLERWLVFAGERRHRREFEVVVGGGDAASEEGMHVRSSRRHVFDDIEVKNGRVEVKGRSLEIVEDTCPPKNALLVMRCRSDPMKMDALANRFNCEYENEDLEENNHGGFEGEENIVKESEKNTVVNEEHEQEIKAKAEEEEEIESNMSSFEALLDQEKVEEGQAISSTAQSEKEHDEIDDVVSEKENQELENPGDLPECLLLMMCEPKLSMEISRETWVRSGEFVRWLPDRPRKPAKVAAGCEHRQVIKRRPMGDSKAKTSAPAPIKRNERRSIQPPRSSCSLPAASVVTMIERESGAHEPFALTRCKSEPMRTAAAKLMPEDGVAGVGAEVGLGQKSIK